MQLLSEYFDEISNNDCGVCDNCLSKKKQATPQADLEQYRKLIINHLISNSDTNLNEFVAQNRNLNQEILKEVLQKLIDNEIISFQKGGIIRLK